MSRLLESSLAMIPLKINVIAIILLVIYFVHYKVKNKEILTLIEHPRYWSLWGVVILSTINVFVPLIFSLEYSSEYFRISNKVVIVLVVVNYYVLKTYSSRHMPEKKNDENKITK